MQAATGQTANVPLVVGHRQVAGFRVQDMLGTFCEQRSRFGDVDLSRVIGRASVLANGFVLWQRTVNKTQMRVGSCSPPCCVLSIVWFCLQRPAGTRTPLALHTPICSATHRRGMGTIAMLCLGCGSFTSALK